MLKALQIEPGPDFLHQLGRHAPPLGGRIQPHAPELVAQGPGHAQALLSLIPEGVHQGGALDRGGDVAIECLDRAHCVAQTEDEGMGNGARGGDARQPRARGRGAARTAAHHGGIFHAGGDIGMDVAGPEAEHGNGVGRLDAGPGRGGPAGFVGQDAQVGGFVDGESLVGAGDAQHDLPRFDVGALFQRPDFGVIGQDASQ